jgi:pterin-4a-carbinolamine dehydratase
MSKKATESSTKLPNWMLNQKKKNVKKTIKF